MSQKTANIKRLKESIRFVVQTGFELGLAKDVSKDKYRTTYHVYSKVMEELAEYSTEIRNRKLCMSEGKDGPEGELVDLIIAIIDYYVLTSTDESIDDITGFVYDALNYAKYTPSHTEPVLYLVGSTERLTTLTQIINTTTYKTLSVFGYRDLNHARGITIRRILIAAGYNIKLFKKDFEISDVIMQKVNRWRKIRGLNESA